jgi:hypothetical protein
VSEMANREIAFRHLLTVTRQLVLMRSPLLIFNLALGSALLALGDTDESVDDADEKDGAANAAADGDLGGIRETCPFLLSFLCLGELVEGFVDCGFTPDDSLVYIVWKSRY